MRDFKEKFGLSLKFLRGKLVTGFVFFPERNHYMIAYLSKVWPSSTTAGSSIKQPVIGHINSSGIYWSINYIMLSNFFLVILKYKLFHWKKE